MRTLGDRVGAPQARKARDLAMRDLLEIQVRMELVDLAQHARDRVEEREAIALGLIDLGEAG